MQPLNALIRTVLQGIVLVAAVAAWTAARGAVTNSPDIAWAHVGWVALQAAGMAVLALLGRMITERRVIPGPPVEWDKWVRAGRTLAAGLATTVATAAVQAVAAAIGDGRYDPQTLSRTVAVAAGMAALAWLHRLLDGGLPLWTAPPPAGPPVSAA